MSKELELIAEALRDAGVRYYDVAAAGVVSRLSEHGYSIVENSLLLATANRLGREHRPAAAAAEEDQ